MMVLAQIDWEQVGTVAVAMIVALGGTRGVEALIVAWRSKQAARDGNGAETYVREDVCLLRHAEAEKRMDERHAIVMQLLGEVRETLKIHERTDRGGMKR